MQPVRLSITGDWWDGYIYSGRLYLIKMDGTVTIVPWPRLIDRLIDRYGLDRLAAELAFVDARYLYGDQWTRLVQDREIHDVLQRKFARLASEDLVVDDTDLKAIGAQTVERAAPELVADIEIHRGVIYFGGEDGLWAQHQARMSNWRPSERIWDCPVFRVRASRGLLALAAGPDGLFQGHAQGRLPRTMEDADPVVIGDFFSCGWLGNDIYGSSYANAGMLAMFRQEKARKQRVTHRVFEAAVGDQTLFDPARRMQELRLTRDSSAVVDEPQLPVDAADEADGPRENVVFERRQPPPHAGPHTVGLSWGGQDRICQITGEQVRVAMYKSRAGGLADRFRQSPSLPLGASERVVTGDVAPFGVVVETGDNLFVLADEGVWSLGYEPARWRSFQRATNYPNHLHVIGEGKFDIFSFLTDSLQDLRSRDTPLGRAGTKR